MNEKGYKIMYDYNVLSAGKFATLREGSADVTRLYAEVERAKEALKQAKADTADGIIKVLADKPDFLPDLRPTGRCHGLSIRRHFADDGRPP
jgi:hypothetical protein